MHCQVKVFKSSSRDTQEGRGKALIISLLCEQDSPLGIYRLVHGQLTALTKLGDETIKLAVMEKLAASFPGVLNQRKIY